MSIEDDDELLRSGGGLRNVPTTFQIGGRTVTEEEFEEHLRGQSVLRAAQRSVKDEQNVTDLRERVGDLVSHVRHLEQRLAKVSADRRIIELETAARYEEKLAKAERAKTPDIRRYTVSGTFASDPSPLAPVEDRFKLTFAAYNAEDAMKQARIRLRVEQDSGPLWVRFDNVEPV